MARIGLVTLGEPDLQNPAAPRVALGLAALDAPAPLTTIAPSPTAHAIGFDRSGRVLYDPSVPTKGLDHLELDAYPLAGGPSVVLGRNVVRIGLSRTGAEEALIVMERSRFTSSSPVTASIFTLAKRTTPRLVLPSVTGAAVHADVVYYSTSSAIYEVVLP